MTCPCSKILTLISLFAVTLVHLSTAVEAKENQDGVAVIVGNRSYQDKDIPNVDFAHRDAEAIYRFVRDSLGFREENIILLKDASQAKMESAFGKKGNHRGRVFQYIHPDKSDLFVFFSGHGVPGITVGGSYLLPTDAAAETAEINGYPIEVLYENLSKSEARSITVFLDACFSGKSHKGSLLKGASGIQVMPQPKKMKVPMTVITAASQDQLASWDEDAKHGLFTEYLLRALYGEADKADWGNDDGKVSLGEVEAFLDDEMRYKARRAYNREQRPSVIGDMDQVLVASLDGKFPQRPVLENITETVPPRVANFELEPLEAEMVALKNANVRAKPSVESAKVDMLHEGETIHVPGKVKGLSWYAVEHDGKRVGYIYSPLLAMAVAEDDLAKTSPEEEGIEMGKENVWELRRELGRTMERMKTILSNQQFHKQVNLKVACQNGAPKGCSTQAVSAMNYVDVEINPNNCRLDFAINLTHDGYVSWDNKRIGAYYDGKPFSMDMTRKFTSKSRLLEIKNHKQKVRAKKWLYRYGKAVFVNANARDRFVKLAKKVRKQCNTPGVMVLNDEREPGGSTVRTYLPPPRDYRDDLLHRPPPPPPHRRPPPPRRF